MVDRAIGVLLAIITVASVAVILSKKSDTSKVLDSLFGGLGGFLKTAVSPITAA